MRKNEATFFKAKDEDVAEATESAGIILLQKYFHKAQGTECTAEKINVLQTGPDQLVTAVL